MLVSFAEDLSSRFDWASTHTEIIEALAEKAKTSADVKWERGQDVRFTLPGASVTQHDLVIAEIYKVDPEARVRTARATYDNADDFNSQMQGRVS